VAAVILNKSIDQFNASFLYSFIFVLSLTDSNILMVEYIYFFIQSWKIYIFFIFLFRVGKYIFS